MKTLKFYCPICNSTNVQGKAWADLNDTKREIEFIESNDEEDFWCKDCEKHIIPVLK